MAGLEAGMAMLGAVTRLRPLPCAWWLMENGVPGSSLCKTHLGLAEASSRSCREGCRMEGEESQGAEGHIRLAVSHLGPARQTQVGNADSTLVLSS